MRPLVAAHHLPAEDLLGQVRTAALPGRNHQGAPPARDPPRLVEQRNHDQGSLGPWLWLSFSFSCSWSFSLPAMPAMGSEPRGCDGNRAGASHEHPG